ncbi:MAG: glucose 1-dehydrogenase [Mesorhizobium sp.]|nr:MAG: glucose 1-dehydrogenase [Mesorhizobium sp.]
MYLQDEFKGKVIFITGGANGIGRATALSFARAGASVALADIDETQNEMSAQQIREIGGSVLSLKCDVTVEAEVKSALDKTVQAFSRLDIAFNNAGKYQRIAPAADTTEEEWRRTLDLNVTGTFLCMRNEIRIMLAQGGGIIVNTASGAGLVGIYDGAAYAAAKHAVMGLTKSAALDYATKGVRINAVCPGVIETNMMREVSGNTPEGIEKMLAIEPIGRLGQPEEIASAVMWLSSSKAGFCIGHGLAVDGGHTMH